jgi:hypothetical protein
VQHIAYRADWELRFHTPIQRLADARRAAGATLAPVFVARVAVVVGLLAAHGLAGASQSPPGCDSADDCRLRTREAISAQQFERAHDLAWLAYQKAPRNHVDTMTLLARAQSLSGRGDDAYVMLRRVVDALPRTGESRPVSAALLLTLNDSDDFARVRNHPQWTELRGMFEALATPAAATAATNDAVSGVREEIPAAATAAPAAIAESSSARVGEDLALPQGLSAPAAIAYDAVSARFIIGRQSTDALTVLSQTSSNATALTSRGWSGADRATAIAIDRSAGDLWVAAHGAPGAALHRLQLISGRRLEAMEPVDQSSALSAIAITDEGIFLLDANGRRLLRRVPQAKALEVWNELPADLAPTGLASSRHALYVAHAAGMLRIAFKSKQRQEVSADRDAIANLHSLGWHDNVLLGIRSEGSGMVVIRARLNPAGSRVTAVERLDSAAATAATLANGTYYYFVRDSGSNSLVVRGIAAK